MAFVRVCRGVRHFVALDRARDGWLDYESLVAEAPRHVRKAAEIGERDLLTINYTSGTTSRPKGVMITHRNAWVNCVGMLAHIRLTPRDAYLWTLPMFHANGWTFTWTVTAAGGKHVCLRKVEPAAVFRLAAAEARHLDVRRAHRADRAGQRAGGAARLRPARRAA